MWLLWASLPSDAQAGFDYKPHWSFGGCPGAGEFIYSSHEEAISAAAENCIPTEPRQGNPAHYDAEQGKYIYETQTLSVIGTVRKYPDYVPTDPDARVEWYIIINNFFEVPGYYPSRIEPRSYNRQYNLRFYTKGDGKVPLTIEISPVTALPYKGHLTAIEPSHIVRSGVDQRNKDKVKLIAEIKDQNGNLVDAAIKLKVTAIEGSGGHIQAFHTDRNPLQAGKLKVGGLNSDTINIAKSGVINGIVEFEFAGSAISGDHRIEATCTDTTITCEQIGKDSVWVGIQDLQRLPASSNYTFTGGSCHHQNNHYATERVVDKIQGIGRDYRSRFPNSPFLQLNDISLVRGGLFDAKNEDDCSPLVKADWTATHNLHRTGEDVDVRANKTATAIPEENYEAFKDIAIDNGCFADIHKPGTTAQHYHLYCTQKQGK